MTLLLLLGLAFGLATVAPGVLARAAWPYRSPRLGVLAWQVTAITVVVSLVAAVQTMVMPWHRAGDAVCSVWRLCLDALIGAHGGAALVMAWIGLVLLTLGLVRITVAAVPLARLADRRRSHAAMVRLIGSHRSGVDATVLEHPDPAVYLVPGRSHEVVVTTGALARLDAEELAAVLAHERAHARGHHHLPLALTGLLHRAFPALAAFGQGRRQIGRLVEMCADDDACLRHSRLALARALVTLADPATPSGVLAAGGGDALERVHRLMRPPPPLPRPARAAIAACAFALPLAPLVIVLVIPVVPVLRIGLLLW
jgi:Zn-dependent protease with chaperone function